MATPSSIPAPTQISRIDLALGLSLEIFTSCACPALPLLHFLQLVLRFVRPESCRVDHFICRVKYSTSSRLRICEIFSFNPPKKSSSEVCEGEDAPVCMLEPSSRSVLPSFIMSIASFKRRFTSDSSSTFPLLSFSSSFSDGSDVFESPLEALRSVLDVFS
jgi:hypothetical protein